MLLIDIGNSRIKAAYAEKGRLVELPAVATAASPPIEAWQEKIASTAPLRRILVSNVAGPDIANAFERLAFERWQVEPEFVHPRLEFAGMQTRYTDPTQLGAFLQKGTHPEVKRLAREVLEKEGFVPKQKVQMRRY